MTVPRIEDFSETIELIDNFHAKEINDSLGKFFPASYQGNNEETEQIVQRIINDAFSLYDQKWRKIVSTTTSKWLSGQPGAQAALKKRDYKRVHSPTERQIAQRVFFILDANRDITAAEVEKWQARPQWDGHIPTKSEVSEYVAKRNSHENKILRIKRRASSYLTQRFMTWECGVYTALKYYYFTDRWERLYEEAKVKTSVLQAALSGLTALNTASNHLFHPLIMPGFERITKGVAMQIEADLNSGIETLYPLHRKDDTSRERVLAYDLFINNKMHRMGRKSSLIGNLMMLEGIENPLDLRSIERLIAKWDARMQDYVTKMALTKKQVSA